MNKDCCELCKGAQSHICWKCGCHYRKSAEKKCPICGRTSNLVALDKDCPFCYPNRDDISMVGIDVEPVKDLDWPPDTAEKKCDNNCLTFIKNGFCLHTGYPTTDTAEKHGHPGMGPCVCKQCQPTTDTSDWRERLKDEIPNMHEPFRQRHVDN